MSRARRNSDRQAAGSPRHSIASAELAVALRARHPISAARSARRASLYSTASALQRLKPLRAVSPANLPTSRKGAAARAIHRLLHRERSDEHTRRLGVHFGAARVLSTSADASSSRAREWASTSASETGNSSKRVRASSRPEAVVEGCAAGPPGALSDAQLPPRRRVAAARAREGVALSQQPAPPQRRTTPAFVP